MKEAVIVAAKRTAFGKFGGTLKHIEPEMLLKPLFQHFQSYYPEAMAKVIERVAMTYPEIEEVVVMGVPHHRFGEIACMLYTASETLSKSTLRTYLSNRLARYQIPSKIIQVPRMNYTASGKIARSEMKSLYLNGRYKP